MESELFIKKSQSKTLIISFGGCQSGMGHLALFEFKNFLETHFSGYDRLFYIDKHKDWYQKGIEGISKNVDETVSHIKTRIDGYKKVICIGSSAGGYAAILFGSLLNVDIVITFNAQTLLKRPTYTTNLKGIINTRTIYHLYGDISIENDDPLHHISHSENLEGPKNVFIYRRRSCNMKDLRDSGILLEIFHAIILADE